MPLKKTKKSDSMCWRRTKIIATLGPSSNSDKKISSLIDAGANVFRLNMSHGSHEEHRLLVAKIRKISLRKKMHIAILMDLCGPKIRVGMFENDSIELVQGEKITVSCSVATGHDRLIASQYKNLYKDVEKGQRILLDDGKLELCILGINGKEVSCEVVYGGTLSNKKGLNLPDSAISTSSFTAKDRKDAMLAIELKADFIALSFVRDEKCIKTLKRFIKKEKSDIPVIAKIEKPEAVIHIEKILKEADAIMVARGDLGIEMPAQQVPLIQRDLINKARVFSKPVIVATQMLESMITSPRATRAEVSDVATAALSSADAVMLSAETASGEYPVQAVKIMDDILREMEAYQMQYNSFGDPEFEDCAGLVEVDRNAIAKAVNSLANELKLQGIIVPTQSGETAKVLSADRPSAPLIGVSRNEHICRRLSLNWGVVPVYVADKFTHDWQSLCNKVSVMCGLGSVGERVLLVSGFSDKPELSEPVLKIVRIR
ncbi:Pyruvate kinase [hydrothermal vent metagenome]|uniref:pyruvate kinase n=1 Tax=hydrothermal vent metagenome TaxID=652676 RepID=A0A3B0YIQ5_9ZZZZ